MHIELGIDRGTGSPPVFPIKKTRAGRPCHDSRLALRWILFSIGAFLTLFSISSHAAPKPKPGPDLSTPKKAAAIFAAAAEAGDMKTLKLTAFGADPQFNFVKGLGGFFQAEKGYETAAVKQFADKGKLPAFMARNVGELVENSDEKIEGDKATLVSKIVPNSAHQLTLKKEGENWKVDLNSIAVAGPRMESDAKFIKVMAEALTATSKDVEAGKFKTADEAFAAVHAAWSTATAPDRSTPKKAAIAFFKAIDTVAGEDAPKTVAVQDEPSAIMTGVSLMDVAMMQSEPDAMHLTATGSDTQFAAAKGIGDILAALSRYQAAATKQFNNEGRLPFQISLAAEAAAFEETVDGDNATLARKAGGDQKLPISLHRDGGNWKVELSSLYAESMAMGKSGKAVSEAIDAISRDVEAGKYKNGGEALAAMGQAMDVAVKPVAVK